MLVGMLQSLAVEVPAQAIAAAAFFAAAVALLAWGARAGAARRSAPAALYLGLGASLFWPLGTDALPPAGRAAVAAAAAAALAVHVGGRRRRQRDERAGGAPAAETPHGTGTAAAPRAARLSLAIVVAVAAAVLLHDLGGYAGSLVVWESGVVRGFAQAALAGREPAAYAAESLLWDNGVLSAGNTSLFYGAPTYALFSTLGFTPWTLRILAVVATLLSIAVIDAVGRRFFDPLVGAAAAALFGWSTVVLFYGHYGSSPAGTLLAALLALWATWAFLAREDPPWWSAPLCALALFVATLQYAPARIVVLLLLAFVPLVTLWQWRRLRWQRAAGVAFLVLAAAAVWQAQAHFGRAHLFLFARGEQVLHFMEHRDHLRRVLGRDVEPDDLGVADRLEVVARVVEVTLPQLLERMAPRPETGAPGALLAVDPPPLQLYFAPLVLLIVWGALHSLLHLPSWRHACLFLWLAGSTVPLLLTNRVDSHRLLLFAVPIALWGAMGVREAARALAEARVPVSLRLALAAVLGLALLVHDVHRLFPLEPPAPRQGEMLAAAVAAESEPVVIGALWDHRQMGWLQLRMLERGRREPGWTGRMMAEGTLRGLRDESLPPASHVIELERLARSATVFLAPAERFQGAAAAVQGRGVRVSRRGEENLQILRVGAAAAAADHEALPPIEIVPTPTPFTSSEGPRAPLRLAQATSVTHGFAAPRDDADWGGSPIQIGGVRYPTGIGTHAWTRLVFPVPAAAVAFQAVVGVSDRACPTASVTFEVRGDGDVVLFDSGLVRAGEPARAVEVELAGSETITLAVTDAGDGRDCDHANWVRPAFLLRDGR